MAGIKEEVMIKIETDTGCIGKYLRAYLVIGATRIDLGDGDSMNEIEAGKVADELQIAVNEIRLFADRNKEY